jgi:hypothetical protein
VDDRHLLRELVDAAHVVHVEVGHQQPVDFLDVGGLGGGQNAVRIAAVVARPAGVDQQRIAGWRHQQGGLPALHVNRINLQRAGWQNRGQRQRQRHGG